MDLYNIYDNIITCDDLMIYNDITLPQSLSINYYLQYKDNNETLKNLYNKNLILCYILHHELIYVCYILDLVFLILVLQYQA